MRAADMRQPSKIVELVSAARRPYRLLTHLQPAALWPRGTRVSMHGLVAHERAYFALALLLYAVFVLISAAGRSYLGYSTETDLIGGFVPEAQRFLSGEPLQSDFHPPLYAMLLALAYVLFGDWMTAGLVISGLSGLVVLFTTYLFFQQLCDRAVAWGSLLGLFGSNVFLAYSVQATPDVLFLALFSTSCLLALRALSTGSGRTWAICGVVIGLTLLTRTNGFTLLLLLLLPIAANGEIKSSLRHVAMGAVGVAAVVVSIVVYGAVTGSNLLPNSHIGLAMNYFTDYPIAGEGIAEARARFGSLTEVLLYDPIAIIIGYIRDLYFLVAENLARIVTLPLALLFPAGLLVLIGRFPNAVLLVFLTNILAQILLVNFKAFEPRYYLFLTPWIGASAGLVIWLLFKSDWPALGRRLVSGLLIAGIVLTFAISTALSTRFLRGQEAEVAEIVPRLQRHIPQGAKIVARKAHLAFYTGATSLFIPNFETLAELDDYLGSVTGDGPAFLFYGSQEQDRRPQYMALANPDTSPDWLVEIERSVQPRDWVLFRYDGQGERSNR